MPTKCKDSKIGKKARTKRLLIWLFIDFLVVFAVFCLLRYRPGHYAPDPNLAYYESGQVSTYLTHKLSPQFYDGLQLGEPFELIVTQEGLNEIISMADWPKESEGVMLYSPAALFIPGIVVLMGTANVKGVEFVITIELKPEIADDGFFNLQITKIKVGAMNITSLAKIAAKKMYADKLAEFQTDAEELQAKIAASLLDDAPFEPVFKINGKKVRVDNIAVGQGQLIIRFVPVLNNSL